MFHNRASLERPFRDHVGIILVIEKLSNDMKALLYLLYLNDRISNESSTAVNRLTARKLFKQLKFNRL